MAVFCWRQINVCKKKKQNSSFCLPRRQCEHIATTGDWTQDLQFTGLTLYHWAIAALSLSGPVSCTHLITSYCIMCVSTTTDVLYLLALSGTWFGACTQNVVSCSRAHTKTIQINFVLSKNVLVCLHQKQKTHFISICLWCWSFSQSSGDWAVSTWFSV